MPSIRAWFRKAVTGCLGVGALAIGTPGLAVTECNGHVTNVWTGDSGSIWVFMDNTVAWFLGPGDANLKNILSSATTALVTGYSVTVRFQADGVVCGSGSPRGDVVGMYLNNRP